MARSLEARIRELERAASKAVHATKSVSAIADLVVRSAGHRPPGEDAAPSMAEVTPKPSPAPAGASVQEKPMAKIPPGAVARQVTPQYGQGDLGIAVREVAREAARQWGHEHAAKYADEPTLFGKKVAEVYLAASADLSEGFESDPAVAGVTA